VRKEAIFFIGRWATNILLACVAVASSVRPEDAMSNLSGWASKFNLPDPAWLQSHTADSVVFWGAIVGATLTFADPKIWVAFRPRKAAQGPTDPAKRDTALSDAMWRVFEGVWDKRTPPDDKPGEGVSSPEALRFHDVTSEIRQKAFDGALPVWARRRLHSSLYETVPKEFWSNHDISSSYSMRGPEDVFVYVTKPLVIGEVINARTLIWSDFMTSREAVERLWPENQREGPVS
jgi:hypothetical protein